MLRIEFPTILRHPQSPTVPYVCEFTNIRLSSLDYYTVCEFTNIILSSLDYYTVEWNDKLFPVKSTNNKTKDCKC